MVVIGQSGVGRLARIFVSSTARQVLAHAHSPVVVVGDNLPSPGGDCVVGVSMTEGGLAQCGSHAPKRGAGTDLARHPLVDR